jgi:hypothetical protein
MVEGKRGRLSALLALAIVVVFAAQAVAATWNFTWSGWSGGDRDSRTWNATRTGGHSWWKTSCRADAGGYGGSSMWSRGTFRFPWTERVISGSGHVDYPA